MVPPQGREKTEIRYFRGTRPRHYPGYGVNDPGLRARPVAGASANI